MLGTIVNTGTILTGSVLGSVLRKGVKEKYQDFLYIDVMPEDRTDYSPWQAMEVLT